MIGRHYTLPLSHAPQTYSSFAVLRWLNRVTRRQYALRFRNRAEESGDETKSFCLIEFACNHENGIVGLVIIPVEGLQPIDRHILNVTPGTDRRFPVVVPQKRCG